MQSPAIPSQAISNLMEPEESEVVTLLSLPDTLLHLVCSLLSISDLGRCRPVCSRLAVTASDDAIWKSLCAKSVGLTGLPHTPRNGIAPTYMDAARCWSLLCSELGLAFPQPELATIWSRTKAAWHTIREWTRHHLPEVEATLLPGASREEWDTFVSSLDGVAEVGLNHLLSLHVSSAIANGQHLVLDLRMAVQNHVVHDAHPPALSADQSMQVRGQPRSRLPRCPFHPHYPHDTQERFRGVFGGYSAYDTASSTRMFPLKARSRPRLPLFEARQRDRRL